MPRNTGSVLKMNRRGEAVADEKYPEALESFLSFADARRQV